MTVTVRSKKHIGRRALIKSVAAAGLVAMPYVRRSRASDTSKKAAILLGPDGRGDLGWYDLAWHGGNLAKKNGVIEDFTVFTTAQNEALALLSDIASSDEFRIICSATDHIAAVMPDVANQYPNQQFAQLDIYPAMKETDPGYKAVMGLVFAQEQMSAQAGVLSAFLAAHHDFAKCGLVLGEEISVLHDFEIGYKWGVDWGVEWMKANKPDLLKGKQIEALRQNERVLWNYTGTWGDPAKGKAATEIQFKQGAGIVYQVAGGTGLGVLTAADDAHKAANIPIGKPPFAIGVDSDQGWISPHVVTSGLKRVDLAVLASIKLAMENKFRDAVVEGKGVMLMTLANGGVGLSNEQTLLDTLDFAKTAGALAEDKIPQIIADNKALRAAQPEWVWPTLDQLGADIQAGKVEVPKPSGDAEKWGIEKMRGIYG